MVGGGSHQQGAPRPAERARGEEAEAARCLFFMEAARFFLFTYIYGQGGDLSELSMRT